MEKVPSLRKAESLPTASTRSALGLKMASAHDPEELLAAAHAGCFSMALSAQLGNAGMTAESIDTVATVTLDKTDAGFSITSSHLEVTVKIPGANQAKFEEAAKAAETGCPVSRVLNAKISMNAKLVPDPQRTRTFSTSRQIGLIALKVTAGCSLVCGQPVPVTGLAQKLSLCYLSRALPETGRVRLSKLRLFVSISVSWVRRRIALQSIYRSRLRSSQLQRLRRFGQKSGVAPALNWSALGAKNLAYFTVDPGRLLRCCVDQMKPLLIVFVEFGLGHEVRGLHNRFDGIAQVMRQSTKPGHDIVWHFLRFVHHRRCVAPGLQI